MKRRIATVNIRRLRGMQSSKISRDRSSTLVYAPFENGSGRWKGIEFFVFVDQSHRATVARHPLSLSRPVSIRIFIGRSHCIAQNADKSHYPETTGALERAAYLAALKFRSKPFPEAGERGKGVNARKPTKATARRSALS